MLVVVMVLLMVLLLVLMLLLVLLLRRLSKAERIMQMASCCGRCRLIALRRCVRSYGCGIGRPAVRCRRTTRKDVLERKYHLAECLWKFRVPSPTASRRRPTTRGRRQGWCAASFQASREVVQPALQLRDARGLGLLLWPCWCWRLRRARLVQPVASVVATYSLITCSTSYGKAKRSCRDLDGSGARREGPSAP